VVIVLALVVLPIIWTVALSFQELRLIQLRTAGLLGDYTLSNFAQVLTSPGFWTSLRTTLVYSVLGTASSIGLGLVAALALRRSFRGRTLVRAFLSERTSELSVFGLTVPVPTALLTVIVFEMWRSFPFAFLFITARLQAVPTTLDEAARVDGATPTQVFRHITVPQLLPTIAVLSLLRFIWTFNNFDDIYLLTGGGAGTEVISVRVFDYLVSRGDIGAASAQALVLATILVLLVSLYYRFAAKDEVA
jgi:multiple sugar transport system permease protein